MARPTENGGWAPEVTEELKEKMLLLVQAGYKSTSNKFRHIVRIPPEFNDNAREFEKWCIEEYKKHFKTDHCNPLNPGADDKSVKSFYIRCYSCYPFMEEHKMILSIDEYSAFRKVGGKTW